MTDTGWFIEALEQAMRRHGAPKQLISDQASVFTGDAFAELLRQWNIRPRFGAIGKSGSIAVTERVIKTLKYEWLRCVPIIKGFDHLMSLCTEFKSWYKSWRPHMALEGFRPDDRYYERKPETPNREAKAVPGNIERHVFTETWVTAYRLKNAAQSGSRDSPFPDTHAVCPCASCRPPTRCLSPIERVKTAAPLPSWSHICPFLKAL